MEQNTQTTFTPRPRYWCPIHGSHVSRHECAERMSLGGVTGAAGIVFFHRESQTFLMNHRSEMINNPGTWSTLGGAIDDDGEGFLVAALREVAEEIGEIKANMLNVVWEHSQVKQGAHSDWTYQTFVIEVDERWEIADEDVDWFESQGNEWVTLNEMATLPLHPGFKATVHEMVAGMYYTGCFR